MEASQLRLFLEQGFPLLEAIEADIADLDAPTAVDKLRKAGHSAELVSTVLTQAKLRRKAVAKFGPYAERMLFTENGLEMATRLPVGAVHAHRFRSSGIKSLIELGCGIGGDTLAFAAAELNVKAVEQDEVTAAIATWNLASFPNVSVVHQNAEDADISGQEAIWADPSRRTARRRGIVNPEDYSPTLKELYKKAHGKPMGVKVSPALDHESIPEGTEAQWITHNGETVELVLWSGKLAREGVARSAMVITDSGYKEMVSAHPAEDELTGPLRKYIYEPVGSVIRAQLLGMFAREISAHPISKGIAYLTGRNKIETDFASCFEVLTTTRIDAKEITAALAEAGIGKLEIKKRGVDIDPEVFRKQLKLGRSKKQGVLILTRVLGDHCAIIAQRA